MKTSDRTVYGLFKDNAEGELLNRSAAIFTFQNRLVLRKHTRNYKPLINTNEIIASFEITSPARQKMKADITL